MAEHHHKPDPLAATENGWHGSSDASLQNAIEDAWNQRPDKTIQTIRVVDIFVAGHNPISEYRVNVLPGP